ncbi:MAG TPA: peptide chain release factor N(5)-glutamine methyltransferase [Stellaceae bacterium]|nr:peptide chain release factor N(5)-glutamine methyltransferase [Stellaceae bacterium]
MRRTIAEWLGEAAAVLSEAGFAEPRRQARRLTAAALDLTPAELLARSESPLPARALERCRAMLARLAAGEPLSRILGRREFWGLEFALSAATLDPRPDSETVVAAVRQRLEGNGADRRFLDLGTGSGCLLLALLTEFPQALGVGVDIAAEAVATARHNALRLGLGARALFYVGDWAEALAGRFDAIVANPPYIATAALADLPRAVACFDPRRALDGGADGLAAYRALAPAVPVLLAPGGLFACEIGAGQAPAVAAILTENGLASAGFVRDLAGIERVLVAYCGRGRGAGR